MTERPNPTSSPNAAIYSDLSDDPEMQDLIDLFVGEMPAKVGELRRLSIAGDLMQIQRTAHQMKGACGGYGFPGLSAAAARMEDFLKALGPVAKADEQVLGRVRRDVEGLIELCSRVAKKPAG